MKVNCRYKALALDKKDKYKFTGSSSRERTSANFKSQRRCRYMFEYNITSHETWE